MRRLSPIWLALLALLPGCYDHLYVPPAELPRLSGYDIHNETQYHVGGRHPYNAIATDRPYRVVSTDGKPIDFNSQTELYLHTRDGQRVGGHYLAVDVDATTFRAQTVAGPLMVPLTDVTAVETWKYSPNKSLGVLLGVVGGIAVASGAIVLGVALTHTDGTTTVR